MKLHREGIEQAKSFNSLSLEMPSFKNKRGELTNTGGGNSNDKEQKDSDSINKWALAPR